LEAEEEEEEEEGKEDIIKQKDAEIARLTRRVEQLLEDQQRQRQAQVACCPRCKGALG
jgi:hypothetical protein